MSSWNKPFRNIGSLPGGKDRDVSYTFPDLSSDDPSEFPPTGISRAEFRELTFPGNKDGPPLPASPKDRAQTIMDAARKESLEIREKAYGEGFAAGEDAGRDAVKSAFDRLLNSLEEVVRKLGVYERDIYEKAEKQIIDLSLAVAGKIVGDQLSVDRESLIHIVRKGLSRTVDREEACIRLNPSDYERIKDDFPSFLSEDHPESIRFESDGALGIGDCIIETRFGIVDAGINRQLATITRAFSGGGE